MIQINYPLAATLEQVDRDMLPVYTGNDPIFDLFPITPKDTPNVIWDQADNIRGLMQIRGYEGEFPTVPGLGLKRYTLPPGVFGEAAPIGEQEITERRAPGSFNLPIDIADLVTDRMVLLGTRQYNRLAWIMWTLLSSGSYVIPGPTGAILARASYTPQTYTAGVPWSTLATATPLADFRAVSVLHRGHSVTFGSSAKAFMNLVTFNNLTSNQNTVDLGDRRQTGLLKPVASVGALNEVLLQDNLPSIVIHDEGYISDGTDGFALGTFLPYIPDNTVVVVGRRLNGANVGQFQMTRNASNPDVGPGVMVRVVDTGADPNSRPPRKISVYRAFNGGAVIQQPFSIVVMKV